MLCHHVAQCLGTPCNPFLYFVADNDSECIPEIVVVDVVGPTKMPLVEQRCPSFCKLLPFYCHDPLSEH